MNSSDGEDQNSSHDTISMRDQPGYYPGFSTLAQQSHWDQATRETILNRVKNPSQIRFFTSQEVMTLQAILDVVLPQDDRVPEKRIPLLNMIDDRLFSRRFDGYIFEGMPEEDEAHRLGLQGVENLSIKLFKSKFSELNVNDQEKVLILIKDDEVTSEDIIWKKMPPSHYWGLLIQDAVGAYYSHPFSWDEIGFGGPAYPRGYMRLTKGLPEPWEKPEKRYEWRAPRFTQSDCYQDNKELFSKPSRHGEAGTH